MWVMNDTPETLRGRRRVGRKGAKDASLPTDPPAEPAVRALIEQALHPETAAVALVTATEQAAAADASASGRRVRRRRGGRGGAQPVESSLPVADGSALEAARSFFDAAIVEPASTDEVGVELPTPLAAFAEPRSEADADETPSGPSIYDRWRVRGQAPGGGADGSWTPQDGDGDRTAGDEAVDSPRNTAPPPDGGPHHAVAHPGGHRWVYLAVAVFLFAIGFGLWGLWTTFFAGAAPDDRSFAALSARSDRLSQEVSTLRRSDQISRDANRDLERTLAERDEEIAGLRADIAFYERFVGATGQRRGLSVHDLDMRLQSGDAWHFVATLTQNVNRGAVNSGRITMALEGTRNDKLERLSWSTLRKQANAPGLGYSFKYFQQVEGEVMLPAGFKPLRVTVRLVPEGGSAVEQSFPWPQTVGDGGS
jgi:hypothetical protein